MNEDRLAGNARNLGGKIQEGYGRVTGDATAEVKGLANQAAGTAQDLYGQAKDVAADAAEAVKSGAAVAEDFIRDKIERQPYTAVAIAFAIGLAIGWRSRAD
jgi:uncharacterized protein YjbJ (UPF0337 family)